MHGVARRVANNINGLSFYVLVNGNQLLQERMSALEPILSSKTGTHFGKASSSRLADRKSQISHIPLSYDIICFSMDNVMS